MRTLKLNMGDTRLPNDIAKYEFDDYTSELNTILTTCGFSPLYYGNPYDWLEALKKHGLSAAPQGPVKVVSKLQSYIEKYFNDYYTEGYFTDIEDKEKYHEGHVRSVKVDIYERSSIARGKCIEHYGTSCLVCGLNFGEKYGTLGEGFIHIHHLKPLYTIRKDYVVDYKKDLIPVCPNCHAMIHRIPGGENMSIENIRSVLKSIETNFTDIPNDQVDDVAVLSTHSIMSISIANESPTTSVNITDDQISNIIVGASAKHKIFGLGTVKSIDCAKNHIVVSFPIGEKAFLLSDCIKKGYLVFS